MIPREDDQIRHQIQFFRPLPCSLFTSMNGKDKQLTFLTSIQSQYTFTR